MSDEKPPETFRSHLPALAGSVIGTLCTAIIGSHIGGALGTRYALIFGALVSGTGSWWGERAIRRSQAVAQARITAIRKRGLLSVDETQRIERVAGEEFDKRHSGFHFRYVTALAAVAAITCVLTVVTLDVIGARAVANVLPQTNDTPTVHVHSVTPPVATFAPSPEDTDAEPSVSPMLTIAPTPISTPTQVVIPTSTGSSEISDSPVTSPTPTSEGSSPSASTTLP